MNYPYPLVASMRRQEKRLRKRLTDRMLRAAHLKHLPILYHDLMIVSRGRDLMVAAAVLPCRLWPANEAEDFVLLYLDLEHMDGLPTGFYTVQVIRDEKGRIQENARLVDLRGTYVRNCNFLYEDRYAALLGDKMACESRNTLLDSWLRRGEAYGLEGVLGDGSPFVITIEF